MQTHIFEAALAGLLHDVGKFLGRASPPAANTNGAGAGHRHAEAGRAFVEAYVPAQYRQVVDAVGYHHRPDLLQAGAAEELARLVRLADRLAAGGANGELPTGAQAEALVPVLAQVALQEAAISQAWRYRPTVLELENSNGGPGADSAQGPQPNIFPTQNASTGLTEACESLWAERFEPELATWQSGPAWAEQSGAAYFTTLMALLQRHLWFVPASSPWPEDEDDVVWPDVSLFNHLKVTAAIAACLADNFSPAEIKSLDPGRDQPLALLVRGDFSGIQDFIYRITQREETDTDFDHVARRLRGRSFYLSLLGEVAADWLVRQMALPAANILFVGGGQFDLLIPLKQEETLRAGLKKLESWLLEMFNGELDLQFATAALTGADFGDMRAAYQALAEALGAGKRRKWADRLHQPGFLIAAKDLYHRCRVCHLTPQEDPGTCELCDVHAGIGQRLPHTTHLAFVYGDLPKPWPAEAVVIPLAEPFGVNVALLKGEQADAFIGAVQGPVKLLRLNPKGAFIRPARPNLAQGFSFLANAAPLATAHLPRGTMQSGVNEGEVLHFDAIAELSSGAKRLGILKADVDHLGLIFREGLAGAGQATLRPTLGRVMALSSAMDLFFAGWLNNLCAQVSSKWQSKQARLGDDKRHNWFDKVDGLFYVMYAGGDDLLIIGPWDETLQLARHLQAAFQQYACANPNVTLSAGVVQVKSRYPVQRFAGLVDAAEKQAKDEGRNRATVFGQTVPWVDDEKSDLAELLDLGERLRDLMETGGEDSMPRTLLHDLGRLYRVHRRPGEEELKPMWTPRIYYTMSRRLSEETFKKVGYDLMGAMKSHTILIPISYASLITRKE